MLARLPEVLPSEGHTMTPPDRDEHGRSGEHRVYIPFTRDQLVYAIHRCEEPILVNLLMATLEANDDRGWDFDPMQASREGPQSLICGHSTADGCSCFDEEANDAA